MKYIPWILLIIFIIAGYVFYKTEYLPLKNSTDKLKDEIKMWEETIKSEKGIRGDFERLPVEKFFQDDKLTPYGEVEIMRRFDRQYQGVEIYISAPRALKRLADLLRFLDEQRLDYRSMYFTAVIDSIERFDYKYTK
ncbi:MAG: hypothetical protein N3A65_06215 [candidate division WOR-3 bacterium]|nr:hypothetical protein [candidate division WOR-3 bacterium]